MCYHSRKKLHDIDFSTSFGAFTNIYSVILEAKMETLAVLLEPHKTIIATVASAGAYLNQLSGAVVCNTIRKQNSTVGHSIMPFLAGAMM